MSGYFNDLGISNINLLPIEHWRHFKNCIAVFASLYFNNARVFLFSFQKVSDVLLRSLKLSSRLAFKETYAQILFYLFFIIIIYLLTMRNLRFFELIC
jgi:hypothetical protein